MPPSGRFSQLWSKTISVWNYNLWYVNIRIWIIKFVYTLNNKYLTNYIQTYPSLHITTQFCLGKQKLNKLFVWFLLKQETSIDILWNYKSIHHKKYIIMIFLCQIMVWFVWAFQENWREWSVESTGLQQIWQNSEGETHACLYKYHNTN